MSIARFAAPVACFAACLTLAVAAADRRETRNVAPFTSIGVSAPIRVELTQGATDSVIVEGDEEALAQLETVVENGALKLRKKTRENVPRMDKITAYITARSIQSVSASGSGSVRSAALQATNLDLSVSGSGSVHIGQLTASKFDVSVSGSGDVHVAGTADSMTASISGSGDVKAPRLQVSDASVSISGSGSATLWARDRLSARIAGSGDLRYYGDPSVRRSVVGSGSVKRAGATPS
jgi:hypothetical protein